MKTTLLYICYDVSSLLQYNVDDFVKRLSKDNRIINVEINPISTVEVTYLYFLKFSP